MRKLVLILIAFIAVITFIRAYDNSGRMNSTTVDVVKVYSAGINIADPGTGEAAPLVVQ